MTDHHPHDEVGHAGELRRRARLDAHRAAAYAREGLTHASAIAAERARHREQMARLCEAMPFQTEVPRVSVLSREPRGVTQ
jgi:hypothetical protein